MSWLGIVIFLIIAILSSIAQKARESGGKPVGPRTAPTPGPTPLPPWLTQEDLFPRLPSPPESEGRSLEESSSVRLEGEGTQEEGSSMAGWGDEPGGLHPEFLEEQAELVQEQRVSRAEAVHLTSDGGAARDVQIPAPQSVEDDLTWDRMDAGLKAALAPAAERRRSESGGGWLRTRDDLIRAVLAAEILGRPGGWRRSRTLRWKVSVRG